MYKDRNSTTPTLNNLPTVTAYCERSSPIDITNQRAPILCNSLVDGGSVTSQDQLFAEIETAALFRSSSNDATVQRAPPFGNSLNGSSMYHQDQSIHDSPNQQAPMLSNSVIDGSLICPQGQDPVQNISFFPLKSSSARDGPTQRAPTLSNSLIDGVSVCPPNQYSVEDTCLQDTTPITSVVNQRALILQDSLIDGATFLPSLDLYATPQEIPSTYETNLVPNSDVAYYSMELGTDY